MSTDSTIALLGEFLDNTGDLIVAAEKLLASGFIHGDTLFECELALEDIKGVLAAKRKELKELKSDG